MAKRTTYQRAPGPIKQAKFSPNPARKIDVVSAGTASHPRAIPLGSRRPSAVQIRVVGAPGQGTF